MSRLGRDEIFHPLPYALINIQNKSMLPQSPDVAEVGCRWGSVERSREEGGRGAGQKPAAELQTGY